MRVKIMTEFGLKEFDLPFIILKYDDYIRAYQTEEEMMQAEVFDENTRKIWVPKNPEECIEDCSGNCMHCDLSILVDRDEEEFRQEFYGFVDNYHEGDPITIQIDDLEDLAEYEIPYQIVKKD